MTTPRRTNFAHSHISSGFFTAYAIICVLAFAPVTANAQQHASIPAKPLCTSCRIEFEHVARIGSLDGPDAIGQPQGVVRDSRGRLYLMQSPGSYEIVVFDSTGDFLRTIGNQGEGPGEFKRVTAMWVAPGDTLHVMDPGNRRHTVLAPDYSLVRSQQLEARWFFNRVVFFEGGEIAVNANLPTSLGAGFPLHLIDRRGRVRLSFGSEDQLYIYPGQEDEFSQMSRSLSLAAQEGMFWSAPFNRYVLELWDTTGRLHRRYTRNVDWFEPWDHQPGITEDGPGNPQLQDIHEDRLGRLWVMVRVGDRRWRRSVEPYISEGRKFFRPTRFEGVWDTVVEVIQPESGRLIASGRSEAPLFQFLDDSHAWGMHITEEGVPQIDVWRVRLQAGKR